MSQSCVILATISPKPDHFDEVLELLKPLIKGVQDLEPHCLAFQAHREVNLESGHEEIFMVERFTDFKAVEFHQKNPAFSQFGAALEKGALLEKPLLIKIVKPFAGFVRP